MKLYFVTTNDFKVKEVERYLAGTDLQLQCVHYQIQEILNIDLAVVVKDKVLKAYAHLGHPCVVEHGGLLIEALGNLPGGLSKVVWDNVGDKICSFLSPSDSRKAVAQSVIGYCDGKRVFTFQGETEGTIADVARGTYMFQWDPIFIPHGETKTYAEFGFPDKEKYSQAAKAWRLLVESLTQC
jgi:XTP/dITP diphosphohydrolase